MTWGFLWLMLALKIPLAALIYLVWWAIKQEPEEPPPTTTAAGSASRPHPHKPFPRRPRRGPHGDPAPRRRPACAPVRARARRSATEPLARSRACRGDRPSLADCRR